jgi:hypothetical protein
MFCPNAVVDQARRGIGMRFARHPALIAVFLAVIVLAGAVSWPLVWPMFKPASSEVSTERFPVNGPVRQASLALQSPPFRCDSLNAQDCFEMFHRHDSRSAMTTIPFMPLLDRADRSASSRPETDACLADVFHRGDRCVMRTR